MKEELDYDEIARLIERDWIGLLIYKNYHAGMILLFYDTINEEFWLATRMAATSSDPRRELTSKEIFLINLLT